ncbi:carbohydrate ABC transporter permease [Paenibacillus cremeus]|uniref:Carbohydrate ABC transporter permease n=1 Tax=Paenibacillus cremeus TaxID=2163881 RepID=A0A559K511_9BACL|nr:carbohydrate ABC transporter permease [Paenibacillus cremeus]TVY07180.1 carbohydrate ABC transporter permease [Paenibacillus cremeus]
MHTRISRDDKLFIAVSVTLVFIVVAATLYPFLYVFSSSISDPLAVLQNKVWLWPVGFSLAAYQKLLLYPQIGIGYMNTLFYTTVGTAVNIVLSAMMGYSLSRKTLVFRNFFIILVTFTLMFSGGLIPTFLIVKNLGLLDTRWALILPTAISAWNLLLLKTFFENIPKELEEAAIIDGCTDMQVLYRIMVPLSMPALATITLFYAVGHWNSYFNALIYLNDPQRFPIQIFLRNIVIGSQTSGAVDTTGTSVDNSIMTESLKYTMIMIVSTPIIIVYPFIQRHFVSGIMVGSVKG